MQIIGVAPVGSGAGVRGMTVQVSDPRTAAAAAEPPAAGRSAEAQRLEAEAVVFPRARGRAERTDARPAELKRRRAAARYLADGGARQFSRRDELNPRDA